MMPREVLAIIDAIALTSGASFELPEDYLEIPKGSTPNKYTPHVGKKQIAKALAKKAKEAK